MSGGETADVAALCASLRSVGGAPDDAPARHVLHQAQKLWAAHSGGFGVVLLGDHDPHVAPGLHVTRGSDPLTPDRVHRWMRSWEAFDRAFEACSWDQEQALFDAHIAPCFESLGLTLATVDLARDHLFLVHDRYVASFPDDRWAAHATRRPAAGAGSSEQESLLRGLRGVCAARHPLG